MNCINAICKMPATGIIQREFLAGGRKFGKPKTKRKDEIHIVLRPVLVIAQLIAVFPLYGVFTDERQKIRFVLRSAKTFLSFFMICFTGTMTGMAFWRLRTDTVVSNRVISDIMFFGSTCMSMIFFVRLATIWNSIIDEWHKVEKFMIELKPVKIARRVLILTIAFMTMSILEHVLAHLEAIFHPRKEFNFIKETAVAVRVLATMAWNFPDLFIMAVSTALSSKYQQLNNEIESVRHREKPLEYWKKTRENFNKLSVLTKTLDEALSPIILLSFTNNLFFICLQLLNSLKPMQNVYKLIYFYLSFGHILFRTSAVCLTASNVYDNSRAPLSALFSVSSDTFNIEVQRLVEQISFDTPAFTGCKFFTITRSLILTLAGTIVTYEIVLVQFNALTSDTMSTDSLENDF